MDTASFIKLLNIVALVAIMLSIGMTVKFEQLLASARQVRLVALGLIANFVLVPLVTVGLLYGVQPAPPVSVGFLILAVCPGAPVGPTFTRIAKGDVSLATGLMVMLAGLSAVLAPVFLTVLLGWLAPESDLRIDYFQVALTLLITQILPLGIGLGVHEWAPRVSRLIVKPLGQVANLLLLAVVGLILATEYDMLGAIRWRGWLGMILLLAASLGVGWLCGGPAQVTRRAMTVTTGVRNAAVGLVIVGANFANTPAVTAVVAYALVSIFGTLGFGFLLAKLPADGVKSPLAGGTTA